MYERALINPRTKASFKDKVDLWSVGATFFHVATGRLPFQPFDKRNDRQKMYFIHSSHTHKHTQVDAHFNYRFEILSMKGENVIMGWQRERGGAIDFRTELPNDIILSE